MSASSQATKRRNTENKQSRAGERKNTESQLWGAQDLQFIRVMLWPSKNMLPGGLPKKSKVKCPCVLRVGFFSSVCVLAFMCVSLFCCCCWFCGAVCVVGFVGLFVLLACVFIVFGGLCLLVFWVCCWWSTCSAAGGAAAGFVGLCCFCVCWFCGLVADGRHALLLAVAGCGAACLLVVGLLFL